MFSYELFGFDEIQSEELRWNFVYCQLIYINIIFLLSPCTSVLSKSILKSNEVTLLDTKLKCHQINFSLTKYKRKSVLVTINKLLLYFLNM